MIGIVYVTDVIA